MSCPGKIARLPRALREELNRRLERNVPARLLVEWLNSLPEVQEILTNFFNGSAVNEQNICNWRRSGFAEWQTRQDFLDHLREFAADAAEIDSAAPSMADHAANLISIHFAVALRELSLPPRPTPTPTPTPTHPPTPPEPAHSTIHDSTIHDSPLSPSSRSPIYPSPLSLSRLKPLFALSRAVATLRRGDQTTARLKLHQETSASHKPSPSSQPANQAKSRQIKPAISTVFSIPPLSPGRFSLLDPNPAADFMCPRGRGVASTPAIFRGRGKPRQGIPRPVFPPT